MSKFIIFRAIEAADRTGHEAEVCWFQSPKGELSQLFSDDFDAFCGELGARVRFNRDHLVSWSVEFGPDTGFMGGLTISTLALRLQPFTREQLDLLWEELQKRS